ncbi:hypothetical protein RhiirA4_527225 [Rhizophagus irregularis]|uniref:Uncharacterized protein n=1 Tax=Rhizophagus irregularis TaxID=588596 RepID=A0A2I1GRH8_9GLOM|nr:hypothetical protein RhiirA4_527225 [Rhizophagus irregularis]
MSKEVNSSNDQDTAENEIGNIPVSNYDNNTGINNLGENSCDNIEVNNQDININTLVSKLEVSNLEESNTTLTSSSWDDGNTTVRKLEESNTKVTISGRNTSIINWEESDITGLERYNINKLIDAFLGYRWESEKKHRWEKYELEKRQIIEIIRHLAYNNSYRVHGYWICHQWQCGHRPQQCLSENPDMEIIRHLVWNDKYRVFGNWGCSSCRKRWRSAYTWISLQKYIEKTPGKRLNRFNDDYIIQKCKKEECGDDGIILSYEHLVLSEDGVEHKRHLCAKCLNNETCLESGIEEEKILTWETNSNTSSDDEQMVQLQRDRYKSLNKALQRAANNTPRNTNKKTQMQDENENGNFRNPRHQSITMAITDDHDMGENSLKSKESMHKPKTADDLKYFTGLFTYQIRDQQTDQSIIEIINNNKLLEYHVNTLGKITRYGNEYTYVGFFTETAKNNFIQDGRVLGGIGQFKDLLWLNKLNKYITMSVTGIDENHTDIDEVTKELEKNLGKIVSTKRKEIFGGKISMRVVMDIKCTEEELLNTWGILVNGRLIKVAPENYKSHVIDQRGKINASIIGIPNEIEETAFTKQLKDAGARYWYKLNDKNGIYKIIVYFNNKEERTRAISKKLKINEQIFTWFFQTDGGTNGNFRRYRGSNNRAREMQNNRYDNSGRSVYRKHVMYTTLFKTVYFYNYVPKCMVTI